MIEAAALQRVMHLARAVRGDDDDRRFFGLDRTEFRYRDLKIRQDFEQKRFEGLVGAVDFIDEQNRRRTGRRLERLQQGTLHQKALGKDIAPQALAVEFARRLGHANFDHLGRIVPLIDGRIDVEAFIALKPDQPPPEPLRR